MEPQEQKHRTSLRKEEDNVIVNRDSAGNVIGDVTESNGPDTSVWEETSDLTPEEARQSDGNGYTSGPETFGKLPSDEPIPPQP